MILYLKVTSADLGPSSFSTSHFEGNVWAPFVLPRWSRARSSNWPKMDFLPSWPATSVSHPLLALWSGHQWFHLGRPKGTQGDFGSDFTFQNGDFTKKIVVQLNLFMGWMGLSCALTINYRYGLTTTTDGVFPIFSHIQIDSSRSQNCLVWENS